MIRQLVGKKANRILLLFMAYSLMFPVHIFALPQGGTVVSGQARIDQPDALNLHINQATNKAIINWQKFGIARPEAVRFFQPGSSALALNRVIGVDPSIINGLLSANGRIFVINSNGILVGPTGKIDANAFVASTLDITNENFLAGNYIFSQSIGKSLAAVINQGTIQAVPGGSVSLLAPAVQNQGSIVASLGKVHLAAGEQMTLSFAENDQIKFAVDEGVKDQVIGPDGNPLTDSVSNSGTISAAGGEVILSGKTAARLVQSVVNNTGLIEAKSLVNQNGVIRLEGDGENVTANSGTLDVSGTEEGSKGGIVYVLGSKVGIFGKSRIDASGDKGGGRVLIGGDFQGKNREIRNAERTYVGPEISIKADAYSEGDGGRVIVWADEDTRFYGDISVRGGSEAGDGGFVEVSGKQNLGFYGRVDASSSHGEIGTLLLDPNDLCISSAAPALCGGVVPLGADTQTPANTFDDAVGGGPYYVLKATLEALGDVAVLLQASNDIIFESADLTMASNTSGGVTLTAGNAITMAGFNFSTGGGDVTMNAGAGGITNLGTISLSGGTLTLNASGSITQNTGDLITGSTSLIKQGAGTMTLSEANDYTGLTTVSAGTVSLTNAAGLGATSGATTVSSGATLDINNVAVGAEPVTINGTGVGAVGSLISTGTSALAGAVSLGSNSLIGVTGGGSLTLNNIVNGTTPSAESLTVIAGTGAINFSGSIGATTPLGNFEISNASQVDLANVIAANINVNATNIDLNGNTYTANTDDVSFAGDVDLDLAAGTTAVTSGSLTGDNITFTSSINDNVAGDTNLVLNAGAGAVLFNGAVGGTPLGALNINNATGGVTANSAISALSVTINNGGSIDLNGAITAPNGFTSDGGTSFDNTGAAITTGNLAQTADINIINHTGHVEIRAKLDTGSGGAFNGSDITISSSGNVDVYAEFSTQAGSGGTSSISGATTHAGYVESLGAGDISITGGALDTIIGSPLTSFTTRTISAQRHVIINAKVDTQGLGADLILNANTTPGQDGQVQIDNTGGNSGELSAGRHIELNGFEVLLNDADLTAVTGYVDINAPTIIAGGSPLISAGIDSSVPTQGVPPLPAGLYDAINFASGIDMGGNTLTLNGGNDGDITILGAVTGGGNLIAANGDGQSYQAMTLNSLDIQNAQTSVTFNGAINAAGNVNIDSIGTIDINNTINSAGAVAVDAFGLTTIAPGADIAANGGATFGAGKSGTLDIAGNVATTNNPITFNRAVDLTGNVTLNSGTAATNFLSPVDGGSSNLTVTGDLNLDAAVTNMAALSVSGTSDLGANVTTAGTQTYTGTTTLSGGPRTLQGSTVNFGSSVNGSSALTITGALDLDGAMTGLTTLDVSGISNLGANVTTSSTQTYQGTVTLSNGGRTLQGTTINLQGNPTSVDGGGGGLTVAGNLDLDGAIANMSTLSVLGTSNLAGSVATNASQTYANAVLLTGGPLSLSGNNITFGSTLDGPQALTITDIGTTTFSGAVGGISNLGSLSTDALGSTVINGGTVRTSDAQNYNDAVSLGANTSLTGGSFTNTGSITAVNNDIIINFTGAVNVGAPLSSGTGDIRIDSGGGTTVAATGDIQATSGNVTFGAFSPGTLDISGDVTSAGGNITFNRDTTLDGSVAVSTGPGGGNILFAAPLSATNASADALSLTAGGGHVQFSGNVGATQLGNLTVSNAAGGVTANGTLSAASVDISNGGAVTFNNSVTAPGGFSSAGTSFNNASGPVTTTNSPITINHTGAVTLGSLNAGSNVLTLRGATINGGSFTGNDAIINAGTIGLTAKPTPNVPGFTATLTNEVGGVSGRMFAGTLIDPTLNVVSSPGSVIIDNFYTYLASEQRLAEGAIAAISSETAFLDELEELLSKAAQADFFMEPPLLVTIETEQIGQLEYVPPEQIRKKDAEVPVDINEQIRKEDLEKKKEKKPGPTSSLSPGLSWESMFRLRPLRPGLLFHKNAAYRIPGLSFFIQTDEGDVGRPRG